MRRPEHARDAGAKRANWALVVYDDLQVRSLLLKFGNAAATAMVTPMESRAHSTLGDGKQCANPHRSLSAQTPNVHISFMRIHRVVQPRR